MARPEKIVTCVISGSMRRHLAEMSAAAQALEAQGVVILSPRSFEQRSETDGFVFVAGDEGTEAQLESRHRQAIDRASFVWLVCPQGYVGTSATLEVGYAAALDVPMFAAETPAEPAIARLVQVQPDLQALVKLMS
jgi:hypothetical protein